MADGTTPVRPTRSSLSQKSLTSQKSVTSFHGDPETEENIEKIFEGPVKFHLPDTSVECSPQHHHYDERDYKSHRNVDLHVHHPLSPISRKESKASLGSRRSVTSMGAPTPSSSATSVQQKQKRPTEVSATGEPTQQKSSSTGVPASSSTGVPTPSTGVTSPSTNVPTSSSIGEPIPSSTGVDTPRSTGVPTQSSSAARLREILSSGSDSPDGGKPPVSSMPDGGEPPVPAVLVTDIDIVTSDDSTPKKTPMFTIGDEHEDELEVHPMVEGFTPTVVLPMKEGFTTPVIEEKHHQKQHQHHRHHHKDKDHHKHHHHHRHHHHHHYRHLTPQDLDARQRRGSSVKVGEGLRRVATEPDEARMLSLVDLDEIAAHRFGDVSGMSAHKQRKRMDSIIHVARSRHSSGASQASSITSTSVTPHVPKSRKKDSKKRSTSRRKKVYDHTPHEIFVELDELFAEEGHELQWKEKARWIKFEEDVEEGTDRWGKPHVASLTFHSLVELRKHLEHGTVLLDLEETELSEIFHRIVDTLITSDVVPEIHQGEVLRSLLLKHKHVHDRHGLLRNMSQISLGSLGGHHGTPKYTQSEVNFRHYKEKHGMFGNSSSSSISSHHDKAGPSHANKSGMNVHFEGINNENEEVRIPMLSNDKPKERPKFTSVDGIIRPRIPDIQIQSPESNSLSVPTHPLEKTRRVTLPSLLSHTKLDKLVTPKLERAISTDQSKLEGIMKKIPVDAEATTVLVGELDFLEKPALCFVRLAEGTILEGLTEVPIPVRFLFVLLGPGGGKVDYHEVGRCFSTLMSSEHFHDTAYKADSMKDIMSAMNEFIDDSIVLPAGNWDKDLLLPVLKLQNKKMKERQLMEIAEEEEERMEPLMEEQDGVVVVVKPRPKAKHADPLIRTRRIFGGLINDIKRRYPYYLSDFKDALNTQCLAAVFFIFFAALSPAITFGGLLGEKTDNWMGISEMILGTSICGVVFALFSGQPLTIIGVTGPILVFEENLYIFCKSSGIEYLPFRFWTGLWLFIIAVVCVASEGSVLVRFFTRFTEEIFAFLISMIFIYEVFNKLYKIYLANPLLERYGNCTEDLYDVTESLKINITAYYKDVTTTDTTLSTMFTSEPARNQTSGVCKNKGDVQTNQPNTALFSTILMLGTFLLAYIFKICRNSKFLGKSARKMIGDFGIPLAIAVMVCIDLAVGDSVYTQKLDVPNGLVPTDQCKRGWIVNPLGMAKPMNVGYMFAAVIPAMLAFILMFMETLITGLIVNKKENKLKKGSGFHLDLLIIGALAIVNGVLGLPWVWAATVRSVTHTGALTVFSKTHAPGEKPKLVSIHEQRVTAFLVNLIIGLSIALSPLLKQVPLAVLFGVFLYMGVSSLNGIQMVERCELLLMPIKHHPDISFVRGIKTWRMHLFTIIQLGCVAILWIVKITPAALAFPFFLILLVPLRRQLARIFTAKELDALDSTEAGEDEQDCDEYHEAHMPI